MGQEQSKPPSLLDRPDKKHTDIKVLPQSELPALDTSGVALPKAPLIKSKRQLKEEAEEEERKHLVAFSLDQQYDLSTYWGRFRQQFNRNNPLLFFTPKHRIKEARDLVLKQRMREEACRNLGSQVMLKPEQVSDLRTADNIVGGAVHPDTNQIIPLYMRLSGFVVFNTPIALICLFTRNQTPLFNAFM